MNKVFAVITAAIVLAVLISSAGTATAQQEYPNRPIRVIIAYAPGASSDNVARIYGQKLQESWGQPVVNDFRPGGNTVIASEALVKSAPDGYSILLVLNTHAINPLLIKLHYDPIKDFAPVATLGSPRQGCRISVRLTGSGCLRQPRRPGTSSTSCRPSWLGYRPFLT